MNSHEWTKKLLQGSSGEDAWNIISDLGLIENRYKLALQEAMKALYFDDSSDYNFALWKDEEACT